MENESPGYRRCPNCQRIRPADEAVCAMCRAPKPFDKSTSTTQVTSTPMPSQNTPQTTIKCPGCGQHLTPNLNKFCPFCGFKLTREQQDISFCSNCGTKITPTDTYCGECGSRVAKQQTVIKQRTEIPFIPPIEKPNKILKTDQFSLKTSFLPESGVLNLYRDRLEWHSKTPMTIYISDIDDITIVKDPSGGMLILKTSNNKYYFQKINALVAITMLINPMVAMLSDKGGDLESWRSIIDKIRLDL